MFPEGATAPGCFQKLKDLVANVLKAVMDFFKTIFSYFHKNTPIDPHTVNVQPKIKELSAPLPGLAGATAGQESAGQRVHENAGAGDGVKHDIVPENRANGLDLPAEAIDDGDDLVAGQDDEVVVPTEVAVDDAEFPNVPPPSPEAVSEVDDEPPGLVFNLPKNGVHVQPARRENGADRVESDSDEKVADSSSESDVDGHFSDPELEAAFPNPGPRRPKRDQLQILKQGFRPPSAGDKVWEGTFKLSDFPEVGQGGKFFAILKGIEQLWPKIARKEVILGDLLDLIVGDGCISFSTAGHEKDAHVGYTDALKAFQSLEQVELSVLKELTSPRYPTKQFGTIQDFRKPPKPIGNSFSQRVEQMLGGLQITAKDLHRNLIAGILLKGSPQAPEPFGVFASFNDARAKWDFYFLDCGTDDKPISLHRFPGMGTFKNYVAYRAPAKLEDDEHNMFQLIPIALRN